MKYISYINEQKDQKKESVITKRLEVRRLGVLTLKLIYRKREEFHY